MKYSRKKRVRTVATIEKEIDAFRDRYRKHLLWEERNRRYQEKRQQYCSEIEERIRELERSPDSYTKRFGIFRTNVLTTLAESRLRALKHQFVKAESKARKEVPELDFPYEMYPNNRSTKSDWKIIPELLQKELEKAKPIQAQKDRLNTIKARAAKADGRSRSIAKAVKNKIALTEKCPYCGGSIGNEPHADHIYPVSLGGLSTPENMVYVCRACNTKKRNKTLAKFSDENGLNRGAIEKRLKSLGKLY